MRDRGCDCLAHRSGFLTRRNRASNLKFHRSAISHSSIDEAPAPQVTKISVLISMQHPLRAKAPAFSTLKGRG